MLNLRLTRSSLYVFLLFTTILTSTWLLIQQSELNSMVIIGITIDLVILVPVFLALYLRSKKSPVIKVAPIFILTTVLLGFILPKEHQTTLQFITNYIAPVIELTVFSYVIWKVTKSKKYFDTLKSGDFLRRLVTALEEFTGNKLSAKLASTEIGMFYYLLYKWKKPNGYSYHKESGIIAFIIAIAFLVIVETVVLHILLINVIPTIAWILFGLSIYSFFQIISLAKSVILRPIYRDENFLYLHYGWLHSCEIPIGNISSISPGDIKDLTPRDYFLGLIKDSEEKGVWVETKEPIAIQGFIKQKMSSKIFIPVDQPNDFKNTLNL